MAAGWWSCQLWLGGLRCAMRKYTVPRHDAAALDEFCGRFENEEVGSRHDITQGRPVFWCNMGWASIVT